jgi:LacI family transcriptional regulator
MSPATLRDVASMAGVSIGTASQALNNRPNVSSETRARVIDAATSLGYEIRRNASAPCDVPLKVIGMLTKHDYGTEVAVNPFYSHIQAGIESECRRRNLSLMYANIEVDLSNRPVFWPAMISEQRVDGLIVMGTFIEDTIGMIRQQADAPIVLVDSYAPKFPFDSVIIDNFQGGFSAVQHLVANGHRHIGLIGTNPLSPPGVFERRNGYLKALNSCGIPDIYIEESMLVRQNAFDSTLHLIERAPQLTAIFSVNDDTAIGVINAVQKTGRNVPGDISVIGFDNIDLAKEVKPGLTTVHVHKTWMGALGVRFLLDRANYPDQPKLTVTVSTDVIARETVGPARSYQIDPQK